MVLIPILGLRLPLLLLPSASASCGRIAARLRMMVLGRPCSMTVLGMVQLLLLLRRQRRLVVLHGRIATTFALAHQLQATLPAPPSSQS